MKPLLLYRLPLLILFISAGMVAAAQDDATTKFIDSLKQPAPAATDTTVLNNIESIDSVKQEDSSDTSIDDTPVDTAIISNFRQISKDSFTLIKRDKGFYYQLTLDSLLRAEAARIKTRKKNISAPLDPDSESKFFFIFKMLLWVLATAMLFFVVYKLFLGKSALFISNRKNIDTTVNIEEEIQGSQYDSLIKKAEAGNNYRLAVRYLHLQALYNLSEKHYITLATEKTNYQYTNELRKRNPAIATLFTALTYKYEYIWYGEYAITNVMYHSLQQEFHEFNNQTA